jgi:hypothetical protein
MVKLSVSTPEAINPKSNSKTVNKTNEMMGYFNALPAADHAQLLVSLCEYDPNVHTVLAGNADTTFPHPARSLDDYMSQVDISSTKKPRPRKLSRRLILPVHIVGIFPVISFNLDS